MSTNTHNTYVIGRNEYNGKLIMYYSKEAAEKMGHYNVVTIEATSFKHACELYEEEYNQQNEKE